MSEITFIAKSVGLGYFPPVGEVIFLLQGDQKDGQEKNDPQRKREGGLGQGAPMLLSEIPVTPCCSNLTPSSQFKFALRS